MPRPKKAVHWPPKFPRNCPLNFHPDGYQARIAGRVRWIAGKVPLAEAMAVYHRKAAALVAQATPLPEPKATGPAAALTVHAMLLRWLNDRRADVERGELKVGTFGQYRLSTIRLDPVAGHYLADQWTPDQTRAVYDQLAQSHSVDFAKRAVGHFRDACRHAADQGWCLPVRYGEALMERLVSRPAPLMRWRLYTPAEIRQILAAVDQRIADAVPKYKPTWHQMKAMILLALNGGFGAMELSELTKGQVDLAGARLRHTRGKTGAEHSVPLWPETVAALRPVLELRPGDDLLFRTRQGKPWCRVETIRKAGRINRPQGIDNVNWQFSHLVKSIGLKVPGQGFYKLRHLMATTADQCKDNNAVSALMGHALSGAKGHYIRVEDDRLLAVSEFVRHALLNSSEGPRPGSTTPPAAGVPAETPRKRRRPGASRGGSSGGGRRG